MSFRPRWVWVCSANCQPWLQVRVFRPFSTTCFASISCSGQRSLERCFDKQSNGLQVYKNSEVLFLRVPKRRPATVCRNLTGNAGQTLCVRPVTTVGSRVGSRCLSAFGSSCLPISHGTAPSRVTTIRNSIFSKPKTRLPHIRTYAAEQKLCRAKNSNC